MNRFPKSSGVRLIWRGLACGVFLFCSVALRAQTLEIAPGPDSDGIGIDAPTKVPGDSQSVTLPSQLTLDTRFKIYARGLINPLSALGPAVGAGIGQARNKPEEWGQGAAGYGRRFASGYGRNVISATISFGVAAIDHEDPRFMPSHQHGIWQRTSHAIAGTFVTHTDWGDTIPAYSRFAGAYGAALVSNAWYPLRDHTPGAVMERGSTAILSSVIWRLLQEFAPEIFRPFHRHQNLR